MKIRIPASVTVALFLIGCAAPAELTKEQIQEPIRTSKERAELAALSTKDLKEERSWAAERILTGWSHKERETRKDYHAEVVDVLLERSPYRRWPEKTKDLIRGRQFTLGMTTDQVLFSCGSPNHVNRTVNKWGTRQQWVYGKLGRGQVYYLYFEDDILTSWQD